MRVFLAVHPGRRFVRELALQLDRWQPQLPVRWTRPGTWHVTLQFLADWPGSRLPALQEALAALDPGPEFDLVPRGLGGFPNLQGPRVLFLQMAGAGQVERLAGLVRGQVERVWPDGPQDRKPFRGHLTLARIKQPLNPAARAVLARIQLEGLAPIRVDSFHLIESQLLPDGPRYTTLASFAMRKKGE